MSQQKQDDDENAVSSVASPARPALPTTHSPSTAGAREAAPEERRSTLRTLVTLGTLAYAGALAVPAVSFATSTGAGGSEGSKKGARWVRVGRLADLPTTGEPRRLQVIDDERDAFTVTRNQMLGSVWLMREGESARALSATCPHLGCSIDLNSDKQSFGCPCHASRFALSGASDAGPSPRGMDPLETRVVDGWVEVNFRRFRQGTTDREEVSG